MSEYSNSIDKILLQEEHGRRWILNLSMHFRDKSNREKFFVTYADKPNEWRRITVSLDYRDAPEDSLEADLSALHYQRDKSLRVYEAIRDSLPEIQCYDTVINLKLETAAEDGMFTFARMQTRSSITRLYHSSPMCNVRGSTKAYFSWILIFLVSSTRCAYPIVW